MAATAIFLQNCQSELLMVFSLISLTLLPMVPNLLSPPIAVMVAIASRLQRLSDK
jgi:hypothetical protein